MGCADSRANSETPGKKNLPSHPFSEVDVDHLCKEFIFNSHNGLTSLKHFKRVCANLGIDFAAVTAFEELHDALLQSDAKFNTADLFLVSVLLGKGPFSVKSQLWFEFVDSTASGLLDVDCLTQPIAELIRAGIELVPLIAGTNSCKQELRHYQEHLCYRLINSFPAKGLELKEFQERAPAALFSSDGIQDLLQIEQQDPFLLPEYAISTRVSPKNQEKSEFYFDEEAELGEENCEATSESSEEPVVVEVQLPDQRTASIVLHHTDDPDMLSEQFSTRYSLTFAEKTRFLSTLHNIRYSLGYE